MGKILIDTDPGQDIDDLLAMHFALLRPELEILAICSATKPARLRARLVKRLLRMCGREDIPVFAGADLPMRSVPAEEMAFLDDLSQSMNHYCFAQPESPLDEADGYDAAGAIIDCVERNPGEVSLACIAPLTNIAEALVRKPSIAPKVKEIAMMGGELAEDRPEHNMAFDPVAADIVLSSGIPVHMGTWSVTRKFFLTPEDCAAAFENGPPLHKALFEAIGKWHPAQSWKPGPVMYDIFPFLHCMGSPLYEMAEAKTEIELSDPKRLGTLRRAEGSGRKVRFSVEMDAPAVKRLYLSTVRP